PDLRAERIPSEWELGMTGVMSGSRATLTFGGEAYRGDVRDMIVWAPDFRFVWSPRNVDVERSGVEGRAELRLPREGVHLSGSYSLARVTYGRSGARAGGTSGVQLAYRPRHSASLAAGWEGSQWRGELTGRYTGLRYPVPAAVNAMDPFWSFGASLVHSWSWPGWTMRTVVRADRLLDRRDSHIFGFPEPGRTFSVELRVARAP
ncbi:MAG: TonB-dependent receptor, partial [Gemmatimonadota bacterium]